MRPNQDKIHIKLKVVDLDFNVKFTRVSYTEYEMLWSFKFKYNQNSVFLKDKYTPSDM